MWMLSSRLCAKIIKFFVERVIGCRRTPVLVKIVRLDTIVIPQNAILKMLQTRKVQSSAQMEQVRHQNQPAQINVFLLAVVLRAKSNVTQGFILM